MMISQSPWEDKLDQAKVLWRYRENGPHVAYTLSDQHADFYFNSDAFASNPSLVKEASTALSAYLQDVANEPFWIMSYSGGVSASLILAAAMSGQLNKRLAYMDVRTEAINFSFEVGDTVVIVTDDIYSGGSIRKMIKLLKERNVKVLSPLLTVGNFFGSNQMDGLNIVSLISRTLESWPSTTCSLCQNGSLAIPGRREWNKLISTK